MTQSVDQYVYLIPARDNHGTVSWTWLYNGQSGGASTFPPITAQYNSGNNDLYFTIVDPLNQIKFAGYDGPNTASAISIGQKTTSPAKPTGISTSGEMTNISFQQNGIQLKLDDKNSKKVDFVYQLSFVDTANTSHAITKIDPEIRNSGGGGTREMTYDIASQVGLALLAIAVVVALTSYFGALLGARKAMQRGVK